MIATPPPARTRMTNAEFLDSAETNQRAELIDGEVFVDAPTPNHQNVLGRIYLPLKHSLIPNGILFHAPIDVVLGEGYILQPDLVWVAPDSQCVIDPKRLYGAPDLIVEILSPSPGARDRKAKYSLYERHGVREYWMVNADERFVEAYALADGLYKRVGVYVAGEDAEFTSPLLDKPVALARIFTE